MSLPYEILDLLAEIAVWLEDRNAISDGIPHKMILEPTHLLASPACYGSIVYRLALVRDHQVFADAYYLAQATAYRTGSQRAVETEKIFVWL